MSGITFPEASKFTQAPQDFSGCDPFEMPLPIEKTSLAFNSLTSLCIPIVAAAISYKKLGAHLSRTWIQIALVTAASLAINIYIRSQMKSHFFHKKTTQLFDRLINVLMQPIAVAFNSEVESEHFKGTISNSWLKMLPSWVTTLLLKYSYEKKITSLLASCLGKDLSQTRALWEESRRAEKHGDILLIRDDVSGLGIFACIPYHESSRGVFDIHALAVNPNVPSSLNIKTRMLQACLRYLKSERLRGREQLFVRALIRSSDKAEQEFYRKHEFIQGQTVPGYFKDPTETAISFTITLN